jgi:hypothetical protein
MLPTAGSVKIATGLAAVVVPRELYHESDLAARNVPPQESYLEYVGDSLHSFRNLAKLKH